LDFLGNGGGPVFLVAAGFLPGKGGGLADDLAIGGGGGGGAFLGAALEETFVFEAALDFFTGGGADLDALVFTGGGGGGKGLRGEGGGGVVVFVFVGRGGGGKGLRGAAGGGTVDLDLTGVGSEALILDFGGFERLEAAFALFELDLPRLRKSPLLITSESLINWLK